MSDPLERELSFDHPLDISRVLKRGALFSGDPTQGRRDDGFACAFHGDAGPATVHYRALGPSRVQVRAWGPGAEQALERAPAHLGADDRPDDFATQHPLIAPLLRRHGSPRMGRSGRIMERLVPAILGQKVTGKGAGRSYRELVFRHSERAPGPFETLWLPPSLEALRGLAYYDFHPLGVEKKRAMIVLGCVRRAKRIERLADADASAAHEALTKLPGVGPWTAAVVLGGSHGDPDALPVGDYHHKNTVVHAFTGEARGTDEQMLELLEPFRPHRARVLALLHAGGHGAPRFGPRMTVRDIRGE